jgi:hypothetical protein
VFLSSFVVDLFLDFSEVVYDHEMREFLLVLLFAAGAWSAQADSTIKAVIVASGNDVVPLSGDPTAGPLLPIGVTVNFSGSLVTWEPTLSLALSSVSLSGFGGFNLVDKPVAGVPPLVPSVFDVTLRLQTGFSPVP